MRVPRIANARARIAVAVVQDIGGNLERVRERVARAAERAGRRADDVLLIGVSKTVDVARIRQALEAGVPALGENRVQEARTKIDVLGRPVPWHLIGHLQTNKVKDALGLFDVIHSLDRIDLARECDRRARAKGGWAPEAVETALDVIGSLAGVRVRGLMTIPPPVERAVEARGWFRTLRALAVKHGLRELSMGMSADYEVAIEEGATMVRVGTAIFGPRERAV